MTDCDAVCSLEYCPTEEDSLDPSPFWADSDDAKDVKDLGDATINGVKCRHYQWLVCAAINCDVCWHTLPAT